MTFRPFGPVSTERRGAGVVIWIAMGIVIIVGILLAAQHMMGKSSRQEMAAAYLGSRASAILESGLDEATFKLFGEANGRGTKRDLGEALRNFVAPATPDARKRPDRDGWLVRFEAPLPLTSEAYKDSKDVEVAPARYGIIEQEPYPSARGRRNNESRGLIAVETDVTVHLPGASLKIGRKGRQELEFKTIVLGLPWPFHRYTFFNRALAADPPGADCSKVQDRFYAYLCEYNKMKAKMSGLDPFPVLKMDPNAPPETPSAPATVPATGPVYSTLARVGDPQVGMRGWAIPAFWGEALFNTTPDPEEISTQFLLMASQCFRKASAKEAGELDGYYGQLEEPAWREKRTHTFRDLASFVAATSKDGVLELGGVYWIDGPVTLAHTYRGYGVIVTPDPEGIVVRKASREPTSDGHLTLVATRGDVRASGNPGQLDATLCAVHGTVRGLASTRVLGTVYVSYMNTDREEGPEIQKPPDSDFDPLAKDTDEPASGLSRRMRAFIVPRPVRRDFTVSRGRT